MKLATTFPQQEIGTDPGAMKAYAQAAEALGFDSIHSADHVAHVNRRDWPNYRGGFTQEDQVVEMFVLFATLGAVTTKIGFTTGILLLPERETLLCAKQAASVDFMTGGRLRLCIGVGNFEPEFNAIGMNFHNRGKRAEEQIALMRELWTKKTVHFKGKYHDVVGFGSNPLPVQRPIPIWVGGGAEAVFERAGRIADGFLMAREKPGDASAAIFEKIRGYAKKAGRDPAKLGLEGRVHMITPTPAGRSHRDVGQAGTIDDCIRDTYAWKELGATHVVLMTTFVGLRGADQHIDAMRRYQEGISL